MYHSSLFFEVFSLLTSMIEAWNHSQKWTTYNKFWALKSVTERCTSENVEFLYI